MILSSLAQQESESISANVKMGLKMKMKRGELVGFQGALGYDYNKEDKTISVNKKEAEIVQYIFERYASGIGASVIAVARELGERNYKTKRGRSTWGESTVRGILKNEKYKGDIRQGKTFTVDPITHRRLDNFGEEEQYYIENHHEAIVSRDFFDDVQEIMKKCGGRRSVTKSNYRKYTRKYAFSSMMKCGFCGGTITRRNWNSGTHNKKAVCACVTGSAPR